LGVFGLCFLVVVVSLVVSASAIDCVARLLSKMTSHVSLNSANSVTHLDLISPIESLVVARSVSGQNCFYAPVQVTLCRLTLLIFWGLHGTKTHLNCT